MANINNTISLQDTMSKTLMGMIKKLEQTRKAMDKIDKIGVFDKERVAIIKTQAALESMVGSQDILTAYIARQNAELAQSGNLASRASNQINSGYGRVNSTLRQTGGLFGRLQRSLIAQFSLGAIISNIVMGIIYSLGRMVNESIQTASAIVEVQNVINTAWQNSTAEVDKWAKHTLDAVGINELNAKKYAGTMSAMLQSGGLGVKQAGSMAMKLTELAGDLASFYNLKPEETFKKIRSGMAGMVMPLRSLGINMQVAALQAHALAMGFKDKWKNLSEAQKELVRYDFLLARTKAIQGDFSRTYLSFANQQRLVQQNWQMFTAHIAQFFLPAMAAGLFLINNTIKGLYSLGNILKIISPFLAALAATILLSMVPAMIKWIQLVWKAIEAFIVLKWEAMLTWIAVNAPIIAVVSAIMLFVWWMQVSGKTFSWLTGEIGYGVGVIAAGWNNMVVKMKVLWKEWADFVLTQLLRVANQIDMILPTNLSGGVAQMLNNVRTMKVGSYLDTGKTAQDYKKGGITWGNNISKALKGLFIQPKLPGGTGGFGNPDPLAGKGTKSNPLYTKMDDKDIKALVEVAKVNYVNKFIKMQPKLNVSFGDVHQNADVNSIIGILAEELTNAHESALSGAY